MLQVFPYSAIQEVLLKRSIWGMDIRVPYLVCPNISSLLISVAYYSLVVLVSASTREFFATLVDVKETNWQRCVCRKLILILKRVASSSLVCHTNQTKQNKTESFECETKFMFTNWNCWGVTYKTKDICDTFMGEHGRQKQLHISSLISLESIDWCSVIKPQITIANDYFGGEQI